MKTRLMRMLSVWALTGLLSAVAARGATNVVQAVPFNHPTLGTVTGDVIVNNLSSGFSGGPAPSVTDINVSNGDFTLIEALPVYGARFNRWNTSPATPVVLDSTTDASTFFTSDGLNRTVRALFAEATTVLVACNSARGSVVVSNQTEAVGSGLGSGQSVYANDGDRVSIAAVPANGYLFDHWEGNLPAHLAGEQTAQFDSDGSDYSIIAIYRAAPTVLAAANPGSMGDVRLTVGGTVYGPGDSFTYTNSVIGQQVTVEALPNAGHVFVRWTGDVPPGSESNVVLTVATTAASLSFTAQFRAIVPPVLYVTANPPSQGRVTMSVNNGPLVGPNTSVSYNNFTNGLTAEIEAIAEPGFVFESWAGDIPGGLAKKAQVLVPATGQNMTISAIFGPAPLITLTASPTGMVTLINRSPDGSVTNYGPAVRVLAGAAAGDNITVEGFAAPGYKFDRWAGNIPAALQPPAGNPGVFTSSGTNYEITASFRLADTITVSSEDEIKGLVTYSNAIDGTVIGPTGTVVHTGIEPGQLIKLFAIPQPGFVFDRWEGDIPADKVGVINPVFNLNYDPTVNPYPSITAYFKPAPQVIARVFLGSGFPGAVTNGCTVRATNLTQRVGGPRAAISAVSVNAGNQVHVFAFAGPGSTFYKWIGDVETNSAATTPVDFLASGQVQQLFALFSNGDLDADGMPDTWERTYGLNPEDPSDAGIDPDADFLTNLEEFQNNTSPRDNDTDDDRMPDGWEVATGLDPTSAVGDDGADGNPDGDELFNTSNGTPSGDFTNLREFQEFLQQSGGGTTNGGGLVVLENAINQFGTEPLQFDTDGDGMNDGWEVSYGLQASDDNGAGAQGVNGANGNADGDNHWVTVPEQQRSGMTGGDPDTFVNIDEYNRWYVDGVPSSDPLLWDTDQDGMPDGWENDMGLNPVNRNGADGANGNPDGDVHYSVTSGLPNRNAPFTNIEEWDASAQAVRNGATCHPNNPDVDNDGLPDNWELVFGYDAWRADTDNNGTPDGFENPDGDFFAGVDDDFDGMLDMADVDNDGNLDLLIHNNVSLFRQYFNPGTGWGGRWQLVWQYLTTQFTATPDTFAFINLQELNVTCPRNNDTDGDGMWDGWELYVGISPQAVNPPNGPGHDPDLDGLSNLEEFGGRFNNNLTDANWQNKIYPTDPMGVPVDDDGDGFADRIVCGPDTDMDQTLDSWEKDVIYGTGGWNGHCFPGGGGNPNTADTDGDHIPDGWEAHHEMLYGIVDTTVDDDDQDPDNDSLANYQEYWAGVVRHWQYDVWVPDQGFQGYDPIDMFVMHPFVWDWHFYGDIDIAPEPAAMVPYAYIAGVPQPDRTVWYATSYPGEWDSDYDFMDDYYESYHGLNPLFGDYDLVATRDAGGFVGVTDPYIDLLTGGNTDPRVNPFVTGHPIMDPDQDGIINGDEALRPNQPDPQFHHSDPSPHWFTDPSYEQSWVNLYYWRGNIHWFFDDDWMTAYRAGIWIISPRYMYDFEINEGFDTDNDNLGDRAELVSTTSVGSTDPVDSESPKRRRALFLNGNAAARTPGAYFEGEDTLKSFTAEAWVRPTNPRTGQRQIIMERPMMVRNGNVLGYPSGLRYNFQIGVDGLGLPFVGYTGAGFDPIFVEATAPMERALTPNEWAHIAGVYDAARNMLSLYVNGMLVESTASAERPANGYIPGAAGGLVYGAPIVIGAGEQNPGAMIAGSSRYADEGSAPVGIDAQPKLGNFFRGWVDEIRIWDEARSAGAISSVSHVHFDRAQSSSMFTLLYSFSFDDVPDPDYEPVSPEGFRLLNGKPNDGSYSGIEWWRTANDRSTVYNDYDYIVWIENQKNHGSLLKPADSGFWSWDPITEVIIGIEGDTTNVIVSGSFPNSSNPYNDEYIHVQLDGDAGSADAFTLFSDLLPLRQAEADEDVVMWDQIGTGRQDLDSDGDGMPDWWEITHGLDPENDEFGNGADGDNDLDGLSNFDEYLSGTNPNGPDTDGDGILDINEDADGDGLANGYEDFVNTFPNLPDTDDDGYSDSEELLGIDNYGGYVTPAVASHTSDPINSLDPIAPRSMLFDGNDRVVIPPQNKLMLEQFTIQLWANPDVGTDGGVLISRYVADTVTGLHGINYEMGVATDAANPAYVRPYVRYVQADGSQTRLDGLSLGNIVELPGFDVLIERGRWSHLTAVFDPALHQMELYINGVRYAYMVNAVQTPPTVFGPFVDHVGDEVTLGASRSTGPVENGFEGMIDEVRVYDEIKTADEIAATWNGPMAPTVASIRTAIPYRVGSEIPFSGLDERVATGSAAESLHAIVQLNSDISEDVIAALQTDGLRVVNQVSDSAVTVYGTAGQIRALQDVRWAGTVPAAKKVSPLLTKNPADAGRPVVVRFFPGTEIKAALAAATKAGAELPRKDYLGETYLVVLASDDAVAALAATDSVEYLIPGKDSLLAGEVLMMSPTPVKNGVPAARFTTLHEGWDGPGLGSADLFYFFINDLLTLPGKSEQEEIIEAMDVWAEVAALTFTEADQVGLDFSLDIQFANIDGPGGTLGFAFTPLNGDITFDDAENWGIDAPTDIKAVAVHEIGHALGLGHSDDPDAIMFPFYVAGDPAVLGADDIEGIQSIYGKPDRPGVNFRFDDGGITAEDFVEPEDWKVNWKHAAVLQGAVFVQNGPLMQNAAPLPLDTDGDGLPDWWEVAHGLNPETDIDIHGADADPDGDGLTNLGEYQAGTRPNAADTDLDGIIDYNEDSDGDTLTNGDEQDVFGSHPGRGDTDDDGFGDGREVDYEYVSGDRHLSSPVYSRSPLVQRSLVIDGAAVAVPAGNNVQNDRFERLLDWTLEAWVYLDGSAESGAVIERVTGKGQTNFALVVENNVPKVMFTTENGIVVKAGATTPIPAKTWTHLAGVWSGNGDTLSFYLNGVSYQDQYSARTPANGIGRVRLGRGLHGRLDQVAIWGQVLTESAIGEIAYEFPRMAKSGAEDPAEGITGRSLGIFVGINEYAASYGATPLSFCVADATDMRAAFLKDSTQWQPGNMVTLLDSAATKDGVRATIATAAAKAGPGDLVVYYQSSHGGQVQGMDTLLSVHDDDYYDYEMADDLAQFGDGVKVVVILDTCNSAGMFKDANRDWDFAERVMAMLRQKRALANVNVRAARAPVPATETFTLPQDMTAFQGQVNNVPVIPGTFQIESVNLTPTLTINDDSNGGLAAQGNAGVTGQIDYNSGVFAVNMGATILPQGSQFRVTYEWDDGTATNVPPANPPGTPPTGPAATNLPPVDIGFITSADFDEVCIEFGGNGAFTRYVLEAFELGDANGNGLIEFIELYDYAAPRALALYSGQHAQVLLSDELRATRASAGIGGPIAWYPFDDAGLTAEDYQQPLDWDYALVNVTFDSANFVNLPGILDVDDDHIPDWWEDLFFDGEADPVADSDADGLNDLYEFFSDTGPFSPDTNGDGIRDGEDDLDGDGLQNDEEQALASHPALRDTDDDGITDLDEMLGNTDPANSGDPEVRRALALSGTSDDYLDVPLHTRFAMRSWSVEAWICPSNGWSGGGFVLYRQVDSTTANYFIYINHEHKVVGGYGNDYEVVSGTPLVCDGVTWTHVLLSFDDDVNELRLYIDDAVAGVDVSGTTPRPTGVGPVVNRVGERFAGLIDEVRFWSQPVLPESLTLAGDEEGLVAYYRFDDGSSYVPGAVGTSGNPQWQVGQVEDFVLDYSQDWLNNWAHAATLHGQAKVVAHNALWLPVTGVDTDADGMPDLWEAMFPGTLNPMVDDAHLDPDNDGWDNLSELLWGASTEGAAIGYADPSDGADFPVVPVTFSFRYNGLTPGMSIHVDVFSTNSMDGAPDAMVDIDTTLVDWNTEYTVTIGAFDTGHIHQGPAYFFAYFSTNAVGGTVTGAVWQADSAAGIAQYQPIEVGYGAVPAVQIGLTDELLGYGRFAWIPSGAEGDLVAISDLMGIDVMDPYFVREVSYFHEGHYRFLVGGPLDDKSYQWAANGTNGAFNVEWQTPLMPGLVYPTGGVIVNHARNEFVWTADTNAAHFVIDITPDDTNAVPIQILTTNTTTFIRRDSTVHYRLPIYAGDAGFENGTYSWTVTPVNPEGVGPVSSKGRFAVNMRATLTGPYGMSGAIIAGDPSVTGGVYIVQAFEGEGFSGAPVSQVHVDPNSYLAYDMRGLLAGRYGVRAFLDQNGNGRLDDFESYGFVTDPTVWFLWPQWVDVTASVVGQRIEILHRDTDNDGLADAWEYQNTNDVTLAAMGIGTDLDGDGLLDTDEYNYGTDARSADTDGDGLTDLEEIAMAASGMSPSNADDDNDGVPTAIEIMWNQVDGYQAAADMNPYVADSDGDGYSDLEEIASGTDPVNALDGAGLQFTGITYPGPDMVQLWWDIHDNSVTGLYSVVFDTSIMQWLSESIDAGSVLSLGDTNKPVSVTSDTSAYPSGFFRLKYRIGNP